LASSKKLELSAGIKLFDTLGELSQDETDKKIAQDIWDEFIRYNKFVEESGRFIAYQNREFQLHGIPSPRQVIAWRKLILMMGAKNFCGLPFVLNYLKNGKSLFEDQFKQRFGNYGNLEGMEITFACGYFSKFNEPRREKVINFVVNDLLAKGAEVDIWTQDKTLLKEFNKKIEEANNGSTLKKKLHIHYRPGRIDVHYTIARDKNNTLASLLCMEMIHTEAHDFRLETYLTFNELKSFGCDPDTFNGVLGSYTKLNIPKRVLTFFDFAYTCNSG
jgi:hypothetical protein